jgi:hypothetical protein
MKGTGMKVAPVHMREMALAVALIAVPAAAFAQQQTSSQNGNVWNWRAHQPSETGVRQKEEAKGIAPTTSQRDQAAATVDELYRQLLQGKNG